MFSARTLVKICGTTTPQDAVLAAEAGADAIGLIFAPISKRLISADVARQASLAVGPAVGRVGVFMDQPVEDVLRLADAARVSAVQLHGFYTDLDLTRIVEYYPVLRALRPQEVEGWRAQARPDLTLLLDAPQPGSGQPLDWAALAPALGQIFAAGAWLAGGLGPHNVAEAMRVLRPAGVDAVSALEARPGLKDPALVRAFVAAVRQADAETGLMFSSVLPPAGC